MGQLSNLITEFTRIQNEFGYLIAVELAREFNEMGCFTGYSVDLVLCGYPEDGGDKMRLSFTGVKNLRFGDLDRLVKNFISISDISAHQLEGVKYSVKEEENETFSFYCKAFSYEVMR